LPSPTITTTTTTTSLPPLPFQEMALPNLRRLFVEARTEAEENEYSRNAVRNHPQVNSNMIVELCIFLTFMANGLIYLVLQPRIVHIVDCGFQFDGSEDEWWGAEGWEVRPT
jgi:Family of unknown function (DUF5310)